MAGDRPPWHGARRHQLDRWGVLGVLVGFVETELEKISFLVVVEQQRKEQFPELGLGETLENPKTPLLDGCRKR